MKNKKPMLLMGELIGKKVRVIKSPDKSLIGKEGKIIDETMKLLIIEEENGEIKKINKKHNTFMIEGVTIKGEEILFRPEERIKKYWRKFHARMQRQKLSNPRKSKSKGNNT